MRFVLYRLSLLAFIAAAVPVWALSPADRPAINAVIDYGESNYDTATGLIKDPGGAPNLAESSIGFIAACFATGQELGRANVVLGKLLDLQKKTDPLSGHFPWYAVEGAQPAEDATLYIAPLLGWVYRTHLAELSPTNKDKLNASLQLIANSLPAVKAAPQADSRYLLKAASMAMVGAALGTDGPAYAAGSAAAWLRLVSAQGLPQGHSPTADATRLVALKWVREVAPAAQQATVDQALTLAAVDLGLRVDPASRYLAGAITSAYPVDYASASGFAQYVLYTDFGQPLTEKIDPYVMAALLPAWRAPDSVRALAEPGASGLLRTHGQGPVRATDTYLGANFSLGTMCGEVGDSTLPLFLTFSRTARPDAYFYCSPTPCNVQSVQADNLCLSSFNFDGLATPTRRVAFVRGVLGSAEDIEEVYAYGNKWNDKPTSLGEQEALAFTTRGCYVGITITRVGASSNQSGSYAKPASLRWSEDGRKGDLMLTIFARQAEYLLPRPENNMRAGVVIEVVPQSAYLTLGDFAKHLAEGQLKQSIRAIRQRVPAAEKPRDPNVLIPDPQSKIDLVYRDTLEQTSTYTIGGRSLMLVEDLIGNIMLQRQIDGTAVDEKLLWESEKLKVDPTLSLADTLAPFIQ